MTENKPTPTYEEYVQGTLQILQESQRGPLDDRVEIAGERFDVDLGVFSPKHFTDTEFFAQCFPYRPRRKFLEIGPGIGAISIIQKLHGHDVTAVDINKAAVRNTLNNQKIHGVSFPVYHGNLFEPIDDKRYDMIFWNTPFAFVEREDVTMLERAVLDPGYKAIERYVKEGPKHLRDDGRLLLGCSQQLSRMDLIEKFAKESGQSLHHLRFQEAEEVHPVTYDLYELTTA